MTELKGEGLAWLRALRLSALIAAFKTPGKAINESTLYKVLAHDQRFAVSRKQVAEQMHHLGRIGLVFVDELDHGLVITLTDDGVDLIHGRGMHPDVDQPSTATVRRLAMEAAVQFAKATLGEG